MTLYSVRQIPSNTWRCLGLNSEQVWYQNRSGFFGFGVLVHLAFSRVSGEGVSPPRPPENPSARDVGLSGPPEAAFHRVALLVLLLVPHWPVRPAWSSPATREPLVSRDAEE